MKKLKIFMLVVLVIVFVGDVSKLEAKTKEPSDGNCKYLVGTTRNIRKERDHELLHNSAKCLVSPDNISFKAAQELTTYLDSVHATRIMWSSGGVNHTHQFLVSQGFIILEKNQNISDVFVIQ